MARHVYLPPGLMRAMIVGATCAPLLALAADLVAWRPMRDSAASSADLDAHGCPQRQAPWAWRAAPLAQSGGMQFTQTARGAWTAVQFPRPFGAPPVVVVSPPPHHGRDRGVVRVRRVTAAGFEVMFDEWWYQDGAHPAERFSYLAVMPGQWRSADDRMVLHAMTVEADHRFASNRFSESLPEAPVVLAQVATARDVMPVTVRLDRVNARGFRVRLQEEEAQPVVHATEAVHIIAVTPGVGRVHGLRLQAGRTPNVSAMTGYTVVTEEFEGGSGALAQIQTFRGGDTAALRLDIASGTELELWVEEETSRNPETAHVTETFGWVRFAAP